MLMRTGVMAVSAAVAAMMFGCSPQPGATVAVVKDKIYIVTPAAMKVKSGIVSGELTEMKVTERIEEGSDASRRPPSSAASWSSRTCLRTSRCA